MVVEVMGRHARRLQPDRRGRGHRAAGFGFDPGRGGQGRVRTSARAVRHRGVSVPLAEGVAALKTVDRELHDLMQAMET
jgi:hypothetical protein